MYYIQGKFRKNSKRYGKFIAKYETMEEILASLTDKEKRGATAPYFFTHIQLPTERVITENVLINGKEHVRCTPTKLWEALQAK